MQTSTHGVTWLPFPSKVIETLTGAQHLALVDAAVEAYSSHQLIMGDVPTETMFFLLAYLHTGLS